MVGEGSLCPNMFQHTFYSKNWRWFQKVMVVVVYITGVGYVVGELVVKEWEGAQALAFYRDPHLCWSKCLLRNIQ